MRKGLSKKQIDFNRTAINKAVAHFGSQTALGEYFGCSQQSVSFWSRTGRIPLDVMGWLAKFLDVSIEKFIQEIK